MFAELLLAGVAPLATPGALCVLSATSLPSVTLSSALSGLSLRSLHLLAQLAAPCPASVQTMPPTKK